MGLLGARWSRIGLVALGFAFGTWFFFLRTIIFDDIKRGPSLVPDFIALTLPSPSVDLSACPEVICDECPEDPRREYGPCLMLNYSADMDDLRLDVAKAGNAYEEEQDGYLLRLGELRELGVNAVNMRSMLRSSEIGEKVRALVWDLYYRQRRLDRLWQAYEGREKNLAQYVDRRVHDFVSDYREVAREAALVPPDELLYEGDAEELLPRYFTGILFERGDLAETLGCPQQEVEK